MRAGLRFFIRVQNLYRAVPYHNWFHAADVVQTMFLFIKTLGPCLGHIPSRARCPGAGGCPEPTGIFSVLDKYILLLAGSLHDVDHMGPGLPLASEGEFIPLRMFDGEFLRNSKAKPGTYLF